MPDTAVYPKTLPLILHGCPLVLGVGAFRARGPRDLAGMLLWLYQVLWLRLRYSGGSCLAQRLQYPLITEYSLNHIRDPTII